MLTRAAEQVAEHAKRVVKLEIELAIVELKRKLATLGVGIGLLVSAGLLGLFGLGFMLAAIAAGPRDGPADVGRAPDRHVRPLPARRRRSRSSAGRRSRRRTPPVPELALTEARLTMETLKNGSG